MVCLNFQEDSSAWCNIPLEVLELQITEIINTWEIQSNYYKSVKLIFPSMLNYIFYILLTQYLHKTAFNSILWQTELL